MTVIVSTTNKHVHISFYGTTIGFARTCVWIKRRVKNVKNRSTSVVAELLQPFSVCDSDPCW